MLYQEQAPRLDARIIPLELAAPSREVSSKEILMVNGTLLSFIRVSHSSHEPRWHQGVGSHQLRWQSKMDGDQASPHSSQGLPRCRRRWGLHLNTRAANLAGWSTTQVTAGDDPSRRHCTWLRSISSSRSCYFSDPRSCKRLSRLAGHKILQTAGHKTQQAALCQVVDHGLH